ncbi:P-glycoprotein 21 [Actinidia rufa]|uniref:p-glycoprotein 21 n=1 Tax=Actinidia rufa TaxID=165716 RepID=A0A7J0GLC2_9ERIC|nr:P-glycoprotein 21 [Actinidia rufa]
MAELIHASILDHGGGRERLHLRLLSAHPLLSLSLFLLPFNSHLEGRSIGEVIDSFGETVNTRQVVHQVSKIALMYVYLAVGSGVAAFFPLIKGWLLTSRGQSAYTQAGTVVEQTIESIRTVGIANFLIIAGGPKSLLKAYRSGVQSGLASGLGSGVFMFFIFCTYSMAASPCLSAFTSGQVAAFKMFETFSSKPPEIDPYDTNGRKPDDIHGDIELRDIYFSYPARVDELIFSSFSLTISSGTTAALVGQSGSGKSTVISLIQRFYDPIRVLRVVSKLLMVFLSH